MKKNEERVKWHLIKLIHFHGYLLSIFIAYAHARQSITNLSNGWKIQRNYCFLPQRWCEYLIQFEHPNMSHRELWTSYHLLTNPLQFQFDFNDIIIWLSRKQRHVTIGFIDRRKRNTYASSFCKNHKQLSYNENRNLRASQTTTTVDVYGTFYGKRNGSENYIKADMLGFKSSILSIFHVIKFEILPLSDSNSLSLFRCCSLNGRITEWLHWSRKFPTNMENFDAIPLAMMRVWWYFLQL